jgi:hypothetical protein
LGGVSDNRDGVRRRTRLRSGKIADETGRFIVECRLYDRSDEGARLCAVAPAAIPDRILFFDDEQASAALAEVVWRRGAEIGVRFVGARLPPEAAAVRALAAKFYAL